MKKKSKILIIIFITLALFIAYITKVTMLKLSSKGYFDIGEDFSARGQYEQAVMYFEKSLKANPTDIQVEFRLFNAYLDTKQYDKAITLLENQMKKYPDEIWDFQRLHKIGQLFLDVGRYNEAIEVYQQISESYPTAHGGNLGLSEAYEKTGDLNKAIYHKRKAIDILKRDPRFPLDSQLLQRLQNELKSLEEKNKTK